MHYVIIFVLLFSVSGCSKQPAGNKPPDTAIDYLTGSAQIKKGRKASQKLNTISNARDEDFKELGI